MMYIKNITIGIQEKTPVRNEEGWGVASYYRTAELSESEILEAIENYLYSSNSIKRESANTISIDEVSIY